MSRIILIFIDLVRRYYHQPNILRYLKSLDIVIAFDVGAHKGETLEYFFKIANIKKIYSFEPQDKMFSYLKKKYKKNKKIILNKVALSNNSKKKNFYLNKFTLTSTFSKINHNSFWFKIKKIVLKDNNSYKNKILIKTIKLDTYLIKNKIKKIDLLKLDIEGHELQALKGSKNILKKNLIKYLLIEISTSKMYKNYNSKKIYSLLKKNNFSLVKSFKFPFHPFSDKLYVNSKFNSF